MRFSNKDTRSQEKIDRKLIESSRLIEIIAFTFYIDRNHLVLTLLLLNWNVFRPLIILLLIGFVCLFFPAMYFGMDPFLTLLCLNVEEVE